MPVTTRHYAYIIFYFAITPLPRYAIRQRCYYAAALIADAIDMVYSFFDITPCLRHADIAAAMLSLSSLSELSHHYAASAAAAAAFAIIATLPYRRRFFAYADIRRVAAMLIRRHTPLLPPICRQSPVTVEYNQVTSDDITLRYDAADERGDTIRARRLLFTLPLFR